MALRVAFPVALRTAPRAARSRGLVTAEPIVVSAAVVAVVAVLRLLRPATTAAPTATGGSHGEGHGAAAE